MKTFEKTLRDAFVCSLPVMASYLLLGVGFGVVAHANGLGVGWAAAMSLFIYTGAMQYVTIDLIAAGASLLSAALMTVAVSARHVVYGLSMLGRYRGTGPRKPYLIFGLTDETYSMLVSAPARSDGGRFDFWVTLLNQLYWVIGTAAGALVGEVLPFSTEGIDFAMTALYGTAFVNQWMAANAQARQADTRLPGAKGFWARHYNALWGTAAAIVCLLVFGPSKFIIPALALITAGLFGASTLRRAKEVQP